MKRNWMGDPAFFDTVEDWQLRVAFWPSDTAKGRHVAWKIVAALVMIPWQFACFLLLLAPWLLLIQFPYMIWHGWFGEDN